MPTQAKITLNGLARRTSNTEQLKACIRSTGAQLTRKGRSRVWLLVADNSQIKQISDFIYQSGEDSWFWIPKKINEAKPQLSMDELREVAREHMGITVSQLTSLTDCTLAEARIVLDEIEWE